MKQKFTILFDLDGTLVSAPDLMHAHNHVMKNLVILQNQLKKLEV